MLSVYTHPRVHIICICVVSILILRLFTRFSNFVLCSSIRSKDSFRFWVQSFGNSIHIFASAVSNLTEARATTTTNSNGNDDIVSYAHVQVLWISNRQSQLYNKNKHALDQTDQRINNNTAESTYGAIFALLWRKWIKILFVIAWTVLWVTFQRATELRKIFEKKNNISDLKTY